MQAKIHNEDAARIFEKMSRVLWPGLPRKQAPCFQSWQMHTAPRSLPICASECSRRAGRGSDQLPS